MILTKYVLVALAASLFPEASGRFVSGLGSSQSLLRSGCDDGTGIVDGGHCNGTGVVDDPLPKNREGFQFENPSTDCKYVSQMHIWDSFKDLEKDMNKLFTLIHKDVKFTVVGHHPIAGRYHDLLHFYVNALRRVSVLFFDHADLFEIHPQAIFGGCNAEWSVQEIQFKGVMNSGEHTDILRRAISVDPPQVIGSISSMCGSPAGIVARWLRFALISTRQRSWRHCTRMRFGGMAPRRGTICITCPVRWECQT